MNRNLRKFSIARKVKGLYFNFMHNIVEKYKQSNIVYNTGKEYGFCYLFYNTSTNLCKIGYTGNNPINRLKVLESQNGVKLINILYIELSSGIDCTAAYLEIFLHRYFKDKRKFGEWFNLSIKQVIEIFWLFFYINGDDINHISKKEAKLFINLPIPLLP